VDGKSDWLISIMKDFNWSNKYKSNTEYFERALSKSLTTLKEQQKSCIRKLVVDSQGPRCLCRSANWLRRKSYLSGPTGVVF
jgi:hypothetical protein